MYLSLITKNPLHSDIIHWNQSGSTFIIENIESFEKELLPLYFRHNKYQSFVRQLNMYDFHKIRNPDTTSKNQSEFHHQDFTEHHLKDIMNIKRKGFQTKKKDKCNIKIKPIHKKSSKKYITL
jgi:osomolarity two-component system response regulator SKN7